MIQYIIAGAIGYVVAKLLEEDDKPKYNDGGSVLLAPNGKPSNLTPEKYKLVRTPAFKEWFGDWENDPETSSKVVDSNGEPLVVYHGSNVDFNLFENKPREVGRRKTSAKGFYFTKDKWSATQYAGSDGFVKSYFLKIINYPSKKDKKVLEYSNIDDYLFDYGKTIDRFGYDGAIDVQGDFIVWNPNQIKLADGTNTTFDGNNPDIRYAEGGLIAPNGKPSNLTPEQYKLVRTPAFKKWFGDWENDRENSGKVSGITKEPIVFYHSTKSNFLSKKGENIFKNPPFFFSFKKDVSDYIVRIQHQNKKGRVYTKPFFLKYHNTFDLRHVKILKDKELTRLIKKHTFYQTESDIRLFELKLSLSKFSGNTWYLTENEDFQDYIKNKGYDSFVVYEDGDKNIAVFNPNQIKLADGTNTTFDGSNPDIRFDGGGELKKTYQDLIEGYELLLEVESNEQKIKVYRDLIDGYKLALELEEEQIQEVMNKEVVQDDFTPSYLMTLKEYQEQVTPLIQEYKKFLKKNKDWFIKPSFYGLAHYSLEEALEQIDDEDSAFARTTKYSTYKNKKEKEETIRENYGYKKGDKFNKKYTQAPTPPNLIAENKEYIEKLKKYFSIEDLNHSVEDDETKSNKRAVRRAIDNNTYKDLLTNKKVELSKLEQVAESVGIRLPKSIFDKSTQYQMKYEEELGKLLSNIPVLSYEKLKELIEQIEIDLKPLEDEVYEQEYSRYEKIIQDNIGQSKKTDDLNVLLPMWIDIYETVYEYIQEPTTIKNRNGEFQTQTVRYEIINGLKFNWQDNLSQWLSEEVKKLKMSIILAIMKNFERITMPIQSIERLNIKVGFKGFEGSYKFTFENGSSFVMNFQGIGAGGYNIQRYHFRFLTNFSNVVLADGSKGGNNPYEIIKNFSNN